MGIIKILTLLPVAELHEIGTCCVLVNAQSEIHWK